MNTPLCRYCSSPNLKSFLDLGFSPLANACLDRSQLKKTERFYPLHAFVCQQCLLVQLEEYESPETIFSEYTYFSSYSSGWLKHAENYVNQIVKRLRLDKNSLVIEIASNDGYLLQYLAGKNIPVLGIEPAANVAKVAIEKGIPTICEFFGKKTAHNLKEKADLIIGNNVLAHVPDTNDFVSGVKIALKEFGVATFEFPHLLNLIQKNEFDTIYHEHFCYFSLFTVMQIFKSHGLEVFEVEELSTHGGSLRIYVGPVEKNIIHGSVGEVLQKEKDAGLHRLSGYLNVEENVKKLKREVLSVLIRIKNEGLKIIAYGAAAKGNTLLNYCGVKNDFLEYVADKNPAKQGLYLPGTHVPIVAPSKILETKPDYILILPWNLKEEIMAELEYVRLWGAKFIVPIPEVEIT